MYEDKSVNEIHKEIEQLNSEIKDELDSCAKSFIPWEKAMEKVHPLKEKAFILDKYLRLRISPGIEFNKVLKGKKMPMDKFIEKCMKKEYEDSDGYGIYAFDKGVTDVIIKPSDVTFNIYRNDFDTVVWFETSK